MVGIKNEGIFWSHLLSIVTVNNFEIIDISDLWDVEYFTCAKFSLYKYTAISQFINYA